MSQPSTNRRPYKGTSLKITPALLRSNNFPQDYCVIDVETTGFNPLTCSIIELAAVKVRDGQVVETFETYIKPIRGTSVSPSITKLTGIKNRDLIFAPRMPQAISSFSDFVQNDILIGHNAHFDINFVYDAYMKNLPYYLNNNFVDTLALAKKRIPGLPSYKLVNIASHLNIDVPFSHRALQDSLVTNDCYRSLIV